MWKYAFRQIKEIKYGYLLINNSYAWFALWKYRSENILKLYSIGSAPLLYYLPAYSLFRCYQFNYEWYENLSIKLLIL